MDIRRVRASEGGPLRELRLRALLDAPGAFLASYRDEVKEPPSWCDDLANQSEEGRDGAIFIAASDECWIAMAGGYTRRDQPGVVTVWGMWVDPHAGRRGIGRRLLDAIAEWARAIGASRLSSR